MKKIIVDVAMGLLFLVIFLITNNIYLATGVGIVVAIAQFVWLRARGKKMAPMQWMIVGLVVVMGTATILTQNPVFVMIKPTFAYSSAQRPSINTDWRESKID